MEETRPNHTEEVADICAKVAARLIDSISRTAQIASCSTPEMQELMSQWIELIGREVLNRVEGKEEVDVAELAATIGITPSSLLSILLSLQRRGQVTLTHVRGGAGTGNNEDICHCMRE
jgi:predicted Rossmann fold nucleotide-binding protein DprA/Smf involved in DNA uptake